jgi:hypothetical protein
MKEMMSRREALKNLALGAGTLLVARAAGAAAADAAKPAAAGAALPHLVPTDPVAIALSYNPDAKTVDAKKFPNYKPEQNCSNCLQSKGKPGDAWVPCNLFPGKLVEAGGWCKVYVKRP